MHDSRNVAPIERRLSLAAGTVAALAAVELLYRGITGFCPIYSALGVNTADNGEEHNDGASVPYGKGVRAEEAIFVARPASELYEFWRRLDTLPKFMRHVDEVTVLTSMRSRWRVRAPVGSRITWEAEIINDVPGKFLAWRSLPGSPIAHAGSVHFDQRGDRTEVRVVLEYAPPARYVGASIARLLGEEPQLQIAEDLQRFKAIVENGAYA